MYSISKVAEIAYTRIVAGEEAAAASNVLVSAMHPGYCSTVMTSFGGSRSAAKGAETAIWLAVQPRDVIASVCAPGAVSGRFFFDLTPLLPFEADWGI
jgi:NAD(P)-dependent dehydrogenase (short-subunit alcohol dehydrogenase family)